MVVRFTQASFVNRKFCVMPLKHSVAGLTASLLVKTSWRVSLDSRGLAKNYHRSTRHISLSHKEY